MRTVSVIVPAYNTEALIARCIRSIQRQSYAKLEIVVVDDGSTDATGRLCDGFAAEDPRMRVLHQDNRGVSAARNAGLAASAGELVCWLDSDDWLEPGMIESLVAAMEQSGASIALCNYENVYDGGKAVVRYRWMDGGRTLSGYEALALLAEKQIAHNLWGSVAERSLYAGIVFPEGRMFEDAENVYRLFERAETVAAVDWVLLHRQRRRGSIDYSRRVLNRVQSCEAHIRCIRDVSSRHPELRTAFVRSNLPLLVQLRTAVILESPGQFRAHRPAIEGICRFFREEEARALSDGAGRMARLEFRLLTSGTRRGFLLSQAVGLSSLSRSWLK